MEIVDGTNQLPHVFTSLLLAQGTALLHVGHQVSIAAELHHKIIFGLRLNHLVRLDDVRVAKPLQKLRLSVKILYKIIIEVFPFVSDLDGHLQTIGHRK